MEEVRLPPGTKVVDLGALALSSSIASGAIAGAWLRWWIMGGWGALGIGLLTGGVSGWIVGRIWARLGYRRGDDTTLVVCGRSSLTMSLPAGLVGSLATTLLIALLSSMNPFAVAAPPLYFIAVGVGVVVGIGMACIASLT